MADEAGKVFTEAEVEDLILRGKQEEAAQWQGRLTQTQQETAGIRRQLEDRDVMADRMAAIEARLDSGPQRGQEEPDVVPQLLKDDWSKFEDPNDLRDHMRDTYNQMLAGVDERRQRGAAPPAGETEEVPAWAREMQDQMGERELDGMIADLRTRYPWMEAGHVEAVLDTAKDLEVMDLDYVARTLFLQETPSGQPGAEHMPGQPVPVGPQYPQSIQPVPQVLSTTTPLGETPPARHQGFGAQGAGGQGPFPETVSVRGGHAGFEDAERISNEYYERLGR